MAIWLILAVTVPLALYLERRHSAEFWARALAFHEARAKAWGAAADAPCSATIASARASGLRALKDSLRATYPLECVASGLLSPALDQEVEALFEASTSGRWDAARAHAFLREASADLAHARSMQGGEIDWAQLTRHGWPGAVLFGLATTAVVILAEASAAWIVTLAVLGFFVVGIERDRFWTWFGDTLKGVAEATGPMILP